ncbi:MAG: hypothetical protein PHQ74_14930, partial [Crocinitomicaceae bacterium]|nr:hypothetical protein [Crocinitomicaceae bacterium]
TGKLPVGVVKYFDSLGDGVFNLMQSRLHISAGKTYTDPNSDLLIEKQLKVRFKIVPYGSIGEIVADINLNKTID